VDIITVGSGETAVKYLAPYVFRVALSNRNILALKNGRVTFRYRDAKTDTTQTTTLPAEQFIRRFLHHVLPRGFQKVRTYGLLHPKQRDSLARVKELLHHKGLGDAKPVPRPAKPISGGSPTPRGHDGVVSPYAAVDLHHQTHADDFYGDPDYSWDEYIQS